MFCCILNELEIRGNEQSQVWMTVTAMKKAVFQITVYLELHLTRLRFFLPIRSLTQKTLILRLNALF